MKFNIYVPSYKRSEKILTQDHLEYCTYVVRKSEEDLYRQAGVKSIWAIEDDKIDSLVKVHNYIIDNAPEDVVCLLDDDIAKFVYRIDTLETILDKETVTREIERLAQIMVDCGIGYGASPSDMNVKYYDRPFKFTGVTGAVKLFNKSKLKSRWKEGLKFLCDIQLELEELLSNRIILIPEYFCAEASMDVNEGGNNAQGKTLAEFNAENEEMKLRWGKYYKIANGGKAGRVNVKR